MSTSSLFVLLGFGQELYQEAIAFSMRMGNRLDASIVNMKDYDQVLGSGLRVDGLGLGLGSRVVGWGLRSGFVMRPTCCLA